MPGPAPKLDSERVRRAKPALGWIPTQEVGWQHGEVPKPPAKLTTAAREAWATWFGAWFASHWGPEDLPGLRQVVRLYDQVERGDFPRHGELRIAMDGYGITPKGQQMRRWQPPKVEEAPSEESGPAARSRYEHLRSVPAS